VKFKSFDTEVRLIDPIRVNTGLILRCFRFPRSYTVASRLLFWTFALCAAAPFPARAAAFKALIFSATAGYRHASITNGIQTIQMLAGASDFVLQSADHLGSDAIWSPVTNPPVQQNDQLSIVIPVTNSTQFFRLHK
jgi:hypothetical protein